MLDYDKLSKIFTEKLKAFDKESIEKWITTSEKDEKHIVLPSNQTIAKPIVMCRLSDLGWRNRCDTYDAYYKKINDYEVCVSKHTNSKEWSVTLIEWDEGGINSDEITINYDANIDWVIQLTEVLSNGT